jgi:hypothetical protein
VVFCMGPWYVEEYSHFIWIDVCARVGESNLSQAMAEKILRITNVRISLVLL